MRETSFAVTMKICRDDEEHLRKVVGKIDVEILEACVLLRVEDLKKGRSRVSLEGFPHLVDLIDEYHGVRYPYGLHRLDDLARHGSDICPPVSFDLSLIPHSSDAEAEYLLPQRPCDRIAD